MQKFVVVVLFLGLLALPLMAQDNPKAEIFGGYQFQSLGGDFAKLNNGSNINTNGWDASLTGNLNKHFGVTGDFGGVYKTISGVSAHIYTYGGGPVIAYDFGAKINPFVHFVLGGYTFGCGTGCFGSGSGSSSTSGFMMKFGGGVDVKVAKVIAVRAVQFDWDYYDVKSHTEDSNVSISTGIVLRF